MYVNSYGLVPCEILVSEAGAGLRAGEVRGLDPKVAEAMVKSGHAKFIDEKTAKAADKDAAERSASRAKAPAISPNV